MSSVPQVCFVCPATLMVSWIRTDLTATEWKRHMSSAPEGLPRSTFSSSVRAAKLRSTTFTLFDLQLSAASSLQSHESNVQPSAACSQPPSQRLCLSSRARYPRFLHVAVFLPAHWTPSKQKMVFRPYGSDLLSGGGYSLPSPEFSVAIMALCPVNPVLPLSLSEPSISRMTCLRSGSAARFSCNISKSATAASVSTSLEESAKENERNCEHPVWAVRVPHKFLFQGSGQVPLSKQKSPL